MASTTLDPQVLEEPRLFGGYDPEAPTHIQAILDAQPVLEDTETTRKPRQLLKISGEFLRGEEPDDLINAEKCLRVAQEVAEVLSDFDIGIVCGGGNIWRGKNSKHPHMTDEQADYMGMLATLMNSQALEAAFTGLGVPVRVMSAIPVDRVAEPIVHKRALRHLSKGRVVIFACGTGNPHCTTDYAAGLRAVEIGAVCLHKGSHGTIQGIHTADPHLDPSAPFMPTCTYQHALKEGIGVMDPESFALCQKKGLNLHLFNMEAPGSIASSLRGERIGSLVTT